MEFETTRVARAIQHQMRGLQHELRYRRIKRLPLEHSGTKPRILYLTAAYPTFSESYMHDEIDAFRRDFDIKICLLYTSPSPRDGLLSRMPSSA